MQEYETLLCEHTGSIVKITLDRPNEAHSLNAQLAKDLMDVAQYCDSAGDVKAVILTASGRLFCAGGDLQHMAEFGDDVASGVKTLADDLHRGLSSFARMDAPLIVAVNGVAAGAGFSIAAVGDLVIAADSARFTMAYTKAGLSPDGSSSYYLPRLIGLRRTQELMLTNRTLTANEALDWGVVTKVVPDADLQTEAQTLAENIVKGALGSHASVKKLLLQTFNNSLETQMEIEGRLISQAAGSPNGKEGLDAFLNKRRPVFQ
jgi:2-(1,2-epoxy-1,2-dihydrophenyl)acetyl-CoA isomerase